MKDFVQHPQPRWVVAGDCSLNRMKIIKDDSIIGQTGGLVALSQAKRVEKM